MSAQKRLRMRLSELDVFCGDDGRKPFFKTTVSQYVEYLLTAGAGCNGKRTAAGSSFNRSSGIAEQYGFFGHRLKVINTFSPDQLIEFSGRERQSAFFKQGLEAVPVIQRKIFVEVFFVGE